MVLTPDNVDSVTGSLLLTIEQAEDTNDQSDENLDAIARVFMQILADDDVVLDSSVRCDFEVHS